MFRLVPLGDKFLDNSEYETITEFVIVVDETISDYINRADGECYGLSLIYNFKNVIIDLSRSVVIDNKGYVRDFNTLKEIVNSLDGVVVIGGVEYNVLTLRDMEDMFTVISKYGVTFDRILEFTSSYINLTQLGIESDFILRDDVCGTNDIILDYPYADMYNYDIEEYLNSIGLCHEFRPAAIKLFNLIIKKVNEVIPNLYLIGSVRLTRLSYNTIKVEVIPTPSSRRYYLKRMLNETNRKNNREDKEIL